MDLTSGEPSWDMTTYTGGASGEPRRRQRETERSRRLDLLSAGSGGESVEIDVSVAVVVDSERKVCLHD